MLINQKLGSSAFYMTRLVKAGSKKTFQVHDLWKDCYMTKKHRTSRAKRSFHLHRCRSLWTLPL